MAPLAHRVGSWLAARAATSHAVAEWFEADTWAEATSLADLAALTARWLTGDLRTQPGYHGGVDVDEHDAPGMTDVLVALNRLGWLTRNSQAGFDGPGYDHARWTQLAAVDGHVTEVGTKALGDLLAAATPELRARMNRYQLAASDASSAASIEVTWRNGYPFTTFGGHVPLDYLCSVDLRGCTTAAVNDVYAAYRFVMYDPTPGPNTMWADLAELLGIIPALTAMEV